MSWEFNLAIGVVIFWLVVWLFTKFADQGDVIVNTFKFEYHDKRSIISVRNKTITFNGINYLTSNLIHFHYTG